MTTWNHVIISIKKEHLKPYKCKQIICICSYLFWFYGISSFVGYLMPNPFLYK